MSRRVAITVQTDDGLSSLLDPRFGRAPVYLIVDSDSRSVIDVVENQNRDAAHGAGTGAAAAMNTKGVDVVISGRFGPKAFQALDILHIEMWSAPEMSVASRKRWPGTM